MSCAICGCQCFVYTTHRCRVCNVLWVSMAQRLYIYNKFRNDRTLGLMNLDIALIIERAINVQACIKQIKKFINDRRKYNN